MGGLRTWLPQLEIGPPGPPKHRPGPRARGPTRHWARGLGPRQAGTDLEEAAAVTGAGPLTAFVTVTVPASRDAILAGLALAWARALGEFGATITFAGNLAGRTRTLPLEIFLALESDPESAIAVSVLLLSVSFTVLIALRGRWFSRG